MLSHCLSRPALKPMGEGEEKKVRGKETAKNDQIIGLVTSP